MKNIELVKTDYVCEVFSISKPTLYRWEQKGLVPIKKIKIGRGTVYYRKSDVHDWLKQLTEADQEEAA